MTIKGHKPRPFDRVRWDTAPIWGILTRRKAQGEAPLERSESKCRQRRRTKEKSKEK